MPSVVTGERALYEQMWQLPAYADVSPGERLAPMFHEMVTRYAPPLSVWRLRASYEVLDAGCGSAKGAVALDQLGYRVRMCDITDAGVPEGCPYRFDEAVLWRPLPAQLGVLRGGAVDFVYCCDVLEHIPTAYTMLVIARLLEVTRFGLFLNISTVQDAFGLFVGQHLHKTVESYVWWRDHLAEMGTLLESRDLLTSGVFFLAPRAGGARAE